MPPLGIIIPALVICLAALSVPASAQQNPPPSEAVRIASAQNVTVGLLADGSGSTDTRVAADMAEVLDDDDRLRVLPMLGKGAVQNIADLINLKGVDVAIVQADVLTVTMQHGTIPRETSLQYVAKLFPEEVHVLARKDIISMNDLNGKIASVGLIGTGSELTASAILDLLHVKPNILHESQSVALDRLRRGEIAAMFVIGGKPVPMLQGIEPGTGLHFVPIPLNAQILNTYLPSSLDHQRYPNLVPAGQPIDSVAVGSILVTLSTPADTQRGKRINRFVDTLFERFDQFRHPGFHPKWQEVNLSAQVPGLTRYPEVLALLKRDQIGDTDLRNLLDTYLNQSGQTTAGLDNERREALFRDFLRWRDQRGAP